MAIWEYKYISSGKGGFASPQLLENFLNQLGKDEWEIIDYRPGADNPLAFGGLARRPTQRDWTLEAEAAAAAKAAEEKRRAEERAEKIAAEREAADRTAGDEAERDEAKAERDESFRRPRDTDRDNDPEALADEAEAGAVDWDEVDLDDDLPTLFDAVKPHLRPNQRGLGEAAAIDYLAKRWDQDPDDVLGALQECGLTVPAGEDDDPEYFEFEGDLFWMNRNNRGQLFLNVREKPRPRFKPTTMRKVDADDPAAAEIASEHQAERAKRRAQQEARAAAEAAANKPGDPLPEGPELLDVLKPKMRRNRRGPGMSGTVAFMAKALRQSEETIMTALAGIGLTLDEPEDGKPALVEAGDQLFWLKQDNRGGVWINCRDQDRKRSRKADAEERAADSSDDSDNDSDSDDESGDNGAAEPDALAAATEAQAKGNTLAAARLLLKAKSRGAGFSASIDHIADALAKPKLEVMEALVKAGLNVPDDAKEKPVFVELDDEMLWINRFARDESLWLNAKEKPKRAPRGRSRKKDAPAKPADATKTEKPAAPADPADESAES